MGLEIERKFKVKELPKNIDSFPYRLIEQGYLNVSPAIRVRRDNDEYYMTYKSAGVSIAKTEYNMELDKDSYYKLLNKIDGNIIRKKRVLIPLNDDAYEKEYLESHEKLKNLIDEGLMKIELDIFEGVYEGIIIAEVEFDSLEDADNYKMADWFSTDVSDDYRYSNARMSMAQNLDDYDL